MAVCISIETGLTTGLDLEMLLQNSGLVVQHFPSYIFRWSINVINLLVYSYVRVEKT